MADEGEPPGVSRGGKKRWRDMRVEDRFAEEIAKAMQPRERRIGPPPRRPKGRVLAWLGRGKLWDDVFTRTLSGVLTVGIVAVFAALFGVIQFDQQGWAIVVLVGGIVLSVIIVNVWPVRYFQKQWIRWVVFWVLIAASVLVASWLYGPIELPARTGSGDEGDL